VRPPFRRRRTSKFLGVEMADPARAAKLAQRLKVVVAEALGRRVKDPRLEGITVTDARVTNDLQHATIYYTVFGDQLVQAEAAKGLEKAKGVLRQEVGRNITVRLTPTLEFVADQIPVNASNLEELLRAAKKRDAEVAALAENAKHAGDADPYKSDVQQDVDIDEDDFDEEDIDLSDDKELDEDSNK
jgi:ribosome-binding factor A